METDVIKRKKKNKSGIIAGIIMITLGTLLLFFNEVRAVDTEKVIKIAKNEMIEVSSSVIDEKNDGKLIVTSGKINLINDMVYDEEFNVGIKSAKLKRVVEMYQWDENCKDDSNGNEECTYTQKWSSSIIDDSNFARGHNNPDKMPYESKTILMSNVNLGKFKLGNELLNQLTTKETYVELNENVALNNNLEIIDNYYTTYNSETGPQIGDIRISFKYNNASEISVMGVQNNNTFIEFSPDKHDYKILKLSERILSGNDFIDTLKSENKIITWVLRFVGIVMMIVGIACILSLLQYLASYIPFLGKIIIRSLGLISILSGLSLSLIIIAISWLVVRPVLSILLMIVIGGLIYLIIKLNKNKTDNTTPIQEIKKDKKSEEIK